MKKAMILASLAATGVIMVTATIYNMHNNDVCITRGRTTPSYVFIENALIAAYKDDPFLLEELIIPRINNQYNKNILMVDRKSPSYRAPSILARARELANDPDFVKSCCKRVWPTIGIEHRAPKFWDILSGVSRYGVEVKRGVAYFDANQLDPSPYLKERYYTSQVDRLNVLRLPKHIEADNIFIVMDTCGSPTHI